MIIVERKVNPSSTASPDRKADERMILMIPEIGVLAMGHILSHAMHPCINSRRG